MCVSVYTHVRICFKHKTYIYTYICKCKYTHIYLVYLYIYIHWKYMDKYRNVTVQFLVLLIISFPCANIYIFQWMYIIEMMTISTQIKLVSLYYFCFLAFFKKCSFSWEVQIKARARLYESVYQDGISFNIISGP